MHFERGQRSVRQRHRGRADERTRSDLGGICTRARADADIRCQLDRQRLAAHRRQFQSLTVERDNIASDPLRRLCGRRHGDQDKQQADADSEHEGSCRSDGFH